MERPLTRLRRLLRALARPARDVRDSPCASPLPAGGRSESRPAGLLALAVAAGCGSGPPAPPAEPDPRPNLILVSIDTLRADRLGTYGHERDTSPNLDALAERGLLFEQAYSTAPWTLLAHLSMLTGLYVDQHGVRRGGRALSEDVRPLAERLSEAGYDTAGFYYEGWIHPRHGFARGFDLFEPHEDVLEAEQHLAEFLDDRDSDRPLFLFLHLFDVHTVRLTEDASALYVSPDDYARRYRPDAPDLFEPGDARALWNLERRATEEEYDAIRALYDGGIRWVDERLGLMLDDWTERGLLDNTLLAVTSDHGEALGTRDGRLPGHGGLYQEGLHVPLIVTLPGGARAGERVDQAVSIVDLAPTLLAAAEGEAADLPGFDLLAGDRPESAVIRARHNSLLAAIRWPGKSVAIREGYGPLSGPSGWAVRLDADPTGTDPQRYADGRQTFQAVRQRLNAAIRAELEGDQVIAFKARPTADLDDDALDRLRQLGYADEVDGADPSQD